MGKAVFFQRIGCFPENVFYGMSHTNHSMERSKGL